MSNDDFVDTRDISSADDDRLVRRIWKTLTPLMRP